MRFVAMFDPNLIPSDDNTCMQDVHFLAYKYLAESMNFDYLSLADLYNINIAINWRDEQSISDIVGNADFVLHSAGMLKHIVNTYIPESRVDAAAYHTNMAAGLMPNLITNKFNDMLYRLFNRKIQYIWMPDSEMNVHKKDDAIYLAKKNKVLTPITASIMEYPKQKGKVVLKNIRTARSEGIKHMDTKMFQRTKHKLDDPDYIAQEYIDSPTIKILCYNDIILGGEALFRTETKNIYCALSGSDTLHEVKFGTEHFFFSDANHKQYSKSQIELINESMGTIGIENFTLPAKLEEDAKKLGLISSRQGNRLCTIDFMHKKGDWYFIGDVNPLPGVTVFRTMYLDELDKLMPSKRMQCAKIYSKLLEHCITKEFLN